MISLTRVRSLLAVAALAAAPSASDAAVIFEAQLTTGQEVSVTPVVSPAFGVGTFVLNDAQTALSFEVRLGGLDVGRVGPTGVVGGPPGTTADPNDDLLAMHLHRGPAGTNGPVIFGFVGSPINDTNGDTQVIPLGPNPQGFNLLIRGKWDLNEGNGTFGTPPVPVTLANQLPFLLSNGVYVNAHSFQFGGGVIRGQLLVASVPEPTTLALFAAAGAGLLTARRRRAG